MTRRVPTVPIYDPRFQWTSSVNTDIRARFNRVRAAMREQREERGAAESADMTVIQANFAARREGKA